MPKHSTNHFSGNHFSGNDFSGNELSSSAAASDDTVDDTVVDHDIVVSALRVGGRISRRVAAAIELLIGHDSWLRDPDFVHQVIEWPLHDVAFVDWLAASGWTETTPQTAEQAVLAVAVSLASGAAVDLASVIDTCDRATAALIVEAIGSAASIPARRPYSADMIGV